MAVFEDESVVGDLKEQLTGLADRAVRMMRGKKQPGGRLAGEDADRAQRNLEALRDNYGYEALRQILFERMYAAFAARLDHHPKPGPCD